MEIIWRAALLIRGGNGTRLSGLYKTVLDVKVTGVTLTPSTLVEFFKEVLNADSLQWPWSFRIPSLV